MSVRHLRGVELDLRLDVLQKLLLPRLHQALAPFGDEQPPPRLAVAVVVTVLVGDEAWRPGEELRLG
jgi:hypothetical protein